MTNVSTDREVEIRHFHLCAGNGRFAVADPRLGAKVSPNTGRINNYGQYGVQAWTDTSATITSKAHAAVGPFNVADPRVGDSYGKHYGKLRVDGWSMPAHTVTGSDRVGSGALSVADPRATTSFQGKGKYRVAGMGDVAGTVIGASGTGNGAFAVADPRIGRTAHNNVYRLVEWDGQSQAVTSGTTPTSGGQAVADPRIGLGTGSNHTTAGLAHYGILRMEDTSGAIRGYARHDNGAFNVADPRLPEPNEQCAPVIVALDNTWHRPLTTLECAALQGFPTELLVEDGMDGDTDTAWRMRIGNMVPVPTARAIASTMGETLLLAWAGKTFQLSAQPIWVQPFLSALSMDIES